MENMILMFVHALQEYQIAEIKQAFVDWVKSHAEMPTPANIIELIHENRPKPQPRFDHSTPEEYEAAAARKRNPVRVQWFGKSWENFTDDDRKKLAVHLVEMGFARAENYAKYLHDFAKAPSNLFDVLRVSFPEPTGA